MLTMNYGYIVLLMLLGSIWGASYLFIKIGVSELGPLTVAMVRVLVGSLLLLAIVAVRREKLPRRAQEWLRFAGAGLLNAFIPFTLLAWGTQFIPSGLSAILGATMPLFTFVLAILLDGERLTAGRAMGMVISFGGIVVLTAPQLVQGGLKASLWGQAACILASFSYALAIIYARRNLKGYSPLVASLGQVGTGWVLLFPFGLLEKPWAYTPSLRAILALLALGALGTGVAYIIYHRLIQTAGATAASVVTYITPVFGVIWGRIVLGERLGWNAFAALLVILVGLLFVNNVFGRRCPVYAAVDERPVGVGQ
jgi:drug/metabolite transporter (DMT)-like permease